MGQSIRSKMLNGHISPPGLLQFERPRKQTHAHRLVMETAVKLAQEAYDVAMKKNEWYDEWKKKNPDLDSSSEAGREELMARFCREVAPDLLGEARATLAAMLRGPYDEGLKAQIFEALSLDRQLIRGRKRIGEDQ